MVFDLLISVSILTMLAIGYIKKGEIDNVVFDDDFDDDLSD